MFHNFFFDMSSLVHDFRVNTLILMFSDAEISRSISILEFFSFFRFI